MDIELTGIEARVLGALIEKSITTPDYYPLSLNAVVTACNQRSNREPVMSLGESEVMEALDSLLRQHLARERNESGSRVAKYAHRLADELGLRFGFSAQALGVLCVLLLRGPQTPGEIRGRTSRLCSFSGLDEVERTLGELIEDERGPYVTRLARAAGRKEARFAHLLCGPVSDAVAEPATAGAPAAVTAPAPAVPRNERIEALEAELEALRERMEQLEHRVSQIDGQ